MSSWIGTVSLVSRSGSWIGATAAQIVTVGSRGDGRGPVDDDSVFGAASLSKPVFASGVMSLVDAGLLDLDRPLGEYLTEPYLAADERAASITARMVLSHTTGLPNWRQDGPLLLRWSPGTRWGYSGEGYSYLQEVVERLTGTRLDRYLTDAVLRPLGMNDSTFAWQDVAENRLARGHSIDGNLRPPFRPLQAKAAAGGMFTTASDYLRFLVHALADDHRMFEPQARIDDELAGASAGASNAPTPAEPSGNGATTPDTRTSSSGYRRTDRAPSSSPTATEAPPCTPNWSATSSRGSIPPWMCGTGRLGSIPGPCPRHDARRQRQVARQATERRVMPRRPPARD